MNILIIYASHGGVTKRCVDMLKGHLDEHHSVTLVNAREDELPSPEDYDVVVVGSSIRLGNMERRIRKYARVNMEKLKDMPFAVFFCCGRTKRFQEYVETQMPRKLVPSLGYHLFGGELKPERVKGFDKLFVMGMRSAIKSQDFEEDDTNHDDLPEIIPENILLLAKDIARLN